MTMQTTTTEITSPLYSLAFDNSYVRELPADPETKNVRRQVTNACYSRVNPTPVAAPETLAYAKEVARLFDLPDDIGDDDRRQPAILMPRFHDRRPFTDNGTERLGG